MTYRQALKELYKYLNPKDILALQGYTNSCPGSIGICLVVNDIVYSYNDTQENEDAVSELISVVLKRHFGPNKNKRWQEYQTKTGRYAEK